MSDSEDPTVEDVRPPEDPSRNLKEGSTFAQYRVLKKLGEGGFGSVFLVENNIGHQSALKILHADKASDPTVRRRFLNEMSVTLQLLHENAVPVRDANDWKGCLYYTMDYVEGRTLREILDEDGPADPVQATEWTLQTLSFLRFLHERGYCHRDLKPDNLMVQVEADGRERIRVLDLGIAKAILEDANLTQSTMMTGEGRIGTPHYMAPEYLTTDDWDHRIDLWAMGVILYECLSGQRPFQGPDTQSVVDAIAFKVGVPLEEVVQGVPGPLAEVVKRSLQKSPEARYASAAEFADALRRAHPDKSRTVGKVSPRPERPGATAGKGAERKSAVPMLVALLLVLGGAFGAWKFWPEGDAGPDEGGSAAPIGGKGGETATTSGNGETSAPSDGGGEPRTPVPVPPKVVVLQPRNGSRVRGTGLEIRMRITGTPPFTVEGAKSELTPVEGEDDQWSTRVDLSENASGGSMPLALTVVNEAGRQSLSATTYVIDNSAPRPRDLGPTQPLRLGEPGTFRADFDEPVDPSTFALRVGEGPAVPAQDLRFSQGDTRVEWTTTPSEPGPMPLSLSYRDKVGNEGREVFTLRAEAAMVTLRPTLLRLAQPLPESVSADSIEVQLDCRGEDDVECAFVPGVATNADADDASLEWVRPVDGAVRQSLDLDIDQGVARWTVLSRGGGGPAEPLALKVAVDRVGPAAAEATPASDGWCLPGGSITFTADEPLGGATVDGTRVEAADDGSVRIPVPEADRDLEVVLRDRLGNAAPAFTHTARLARVPDGYALDPDAEDAGVLVFDGIGWVTRIVERRHRTGVRLCLVAPPPPEGFLLGELPEAPFLDDYAVPAHLETLSRPYYLSRGEITWGELEVARTVHSARTPIFSDLDSLPRRQQVEDPAARDRSGEPRHPAEQYPVENISYLSAREYCEWLGGSLPTEVQWEWACRSGGESWDGDLGTVYPWGNDFDACFGGRGGFANVADSAHWTELIGDPIAKTTDPYKFSAPVTDEFRPNSWGLVHMVGNVWEWCRDVGNRDYEARARSGAVVVDHCNLPEGSMTNPQVEMSMRGGSFQQGARRCKPTHRNVSVGATAIPAKEIGFRLCVIAGD